MKTYLLSLVVLIAAFLVASCGGGGSTSTATPSGKSKLALTIVWPAKTTSRLIPLDSESITAVLTDSTGKSLGSQTVARPTSGNSSNVVFNGLTAEAVTLTASAYPTTDGTGVAQATGAVPATLIANQTIHVTVTMADTIKSLNILVNGQPINSTNTQFALKGTAQLSVTALNAANQVVLVSPQTITWSSATPSIFSVTSAGLVTSVVSGAATAITVTETESGVKSSVTFSDQTAPAGNNTPAAIFGDPTGKFYYSIGSAGISEFSQNHDGTLSPLSPAVISTPEPATNPGVGYVLTPNFVYIVFQVGDTKELEGFKFQSSGQLSKLSTISLSGGPYGSIYGDSNGKYLFVPTQQNILQFIINSDGSVTANGSFTLPSPEGVTALDVPTGAMTAIGGSTLLVANGEFSTGQSEQADMVVLNTDAHGNLVTVSQFSNQNVPACTQMIQTSFGDGTFYAEGENDLSERPSPEVTELFQLDFDGNVLTDQGPVATVHQNNQPLSLASSAGYLLAFSLGSSSVATYQVQGNGTVAAGTPAGALPATINFPGPGTLGMWITTSLDGVNVYVPDYKANVDSQFGQNNTYGIVPLTPATVPD